MPITKIEDDFIEQSCLGCGQTRKLELGDLTLLAPDIQEEILFMEAVDGAEPISSRKLREPARTDDWPVAYRQLHEEHPG